MSVILQKNEEKQLLGSSFVAYVKGAPEVISNLCNQQSVPNNFHQIVEQYALNGYRIIALACRPLTNNEIQNINQITRENIEKNLTLLGLLYFENNLKPETTQVIKELQTNTTIDSIMITGDNPYTAISVGLQCGILQVAKPTILISNHDNIKHQLEISQQKNHNEELSYKLINDFSSSMSQNKKLNQKSISQIQQKEFESLEEIEQFFQNEEYQIAITGPAFNFFYNQINQKNLQLILHKCYVYSRMKPEQKGQIIQKYKQHLREKNIICMVGDGANDCEAMRIADVSLSLNDQEASLASDFTSYKIQNISCILPWIKFFLLQGRCCLTTSIGSFQFMTLYSMIQFSTVSILFYMGNDLKDNQYLYIDLWLIIPIIFTMNILRPSKKLIKELPNISLFSLQVLGLIIGLIILQFIMQILMFVLLEKQSFYIPYIPKIFNSDTDRAAPSQINTVYIIKYELYYMQNLKVLFHYSSLLYIAISFITCEGKPYRQSLFKNIYFISTFTIQIIVHLMVVILNPSFIQNLLQVIISKEKHIDRNFECIIILVGVISFAVLFFFKLFIVQIKNWIKSQCIQKNQ